MKTSVTNRIKPFIDKGLEKSEQFAEHHTPNLLKLIKRFIRGLNKLSTAFKALIYKATYGLISINRIPWFKIGLVGVFAFVLMKKDVNFHFNLKAPAALASAEPEAEEDFDIFDSEQDARAKGIKTSSIFNPSIFTTNEAAPVSVTHLEKRKLSVKEYIKRFTPVAVSEMKKYGIPASIKMGQALIESRAGSSKLAMNNNNHFGIKCFSKKCAKGHCTNLTDDTHKDFFRKYKTSWESWRAHSKCLSKGRYRGLYKHKKNYKLWARGLRKAGYATDKRYDKKLIKVIEKYELYKLDKL